MIKRKNTLTESKQISEMDWKNIQKKLANDKRPYARKMAKKVDNYMNSDEYSDIYGGITPTPKNKKELAKIINDEIMASPDGVINLTHIDVSQIEDFEELFMLVKYNNKVKSLDVSGWDISKAKNLDRALSNLPCCETINVTDWVLPRSITSLTGLFKYDYDLTEIPGLEDWDVLRVQNLSGLFYKCKSLKRAPIFYWAPETPNNLAAMFFGCESMLEPSVDYFNFRYAFDMREMFSGCKSLKTVYCEKMNTENVTYFNSMFQGCVNLQTLPGAENWNVGSGKEFRSMFYDCKKLKLDISGWNIQDGADTGHMLMNTRNIECDWENAEDLLESRKSWLNNKKEILESGELPRNVDLMPMTKKDLVKTIQRIQKVQGADLDLSMVDVSNIKENIEDVFKKAKCVDAIKTLNVSGWDLSNAEWIGGLFSYMSNLKSIDVTDVVVAGRGDKRSLCRLFEACGSLEEIIGLETWDVTNVHDFQQLFRECKKLRNVNISGWVAKPRYIHYMFDRCESLEEIDIAGFDLSNTMKMEFLACQCKRLKTIYFDKRSLSATSELRWINNMFDDCLNLTSADGIENLDVEHVIDASFAFRNCRKLDLDITNWNLPDDLPESSREGMLQNTNVYYSDLNESRKSWLNYKKEIIECGEIR